MSAARPLVLPLLAAALALAAPLLSGCDRLPGAGSKLGVDTDRFEAALDPAVGGPDTCVVIKDTERGTELYRYGAESACNRPLAPCATFQIPMTVIGLSDGKVAPGDVWKWDGKVQPFKVWEHDMGVAEAWRTGAGWWFQRLAAAIGPDRFKQQLSAFGYGQGAAIGRPDAFWMGPAAGGGLFVSTRNQADLLRKLAKGALPAKPEAQSQVQALMADVTRGQTQLFDDGASCPSIADSSRDVSWWIGRIKGPMVDGNGRDLVFALSIESARPLSGLEIRNRMLPILTNAGLLPNG
ncbi:MAG: penicillin-binding transpeptidase domain-containing protein [Caulobacteraceae bacterium]